MLTASVILQICTSVLLALMLLILNWIRQDARDARSMFLQQIQNIRSDVATQAKALQDHVNAFHGPK